MSSQPTGAVRASPRRNKEDMICRQCPELPLRVQCPHSEEGRIYLSQLASTTKNKPPRAPQRCSKCPNRPLRSQCQHTQAGKTFLLQQAISSQLAAVSNTCPQDTLPPQTPPPPVPPPQTRLVQEDTAPRTITPEPHTSLMAVIPWDFNRVVDPALGSNDDAPNSSPVPPLPLFLGELTSTPPWPFPALMVPPAHTPELESTQTSSSIATPSSQQDTSRSTSTSPSKYARKHERTTKGNPFYGFVKGSMRGTQDHVIFRRHKRPDALLDAKDASKTFLDKINRLVERAEDISVKTGCWLFIGAQHPGGAGATIHYTSPRLLRDAPDHAGDIVNDYHQLMSNLLQARRLEALNISRKYQATMAENQAMATHVAELEGRMMTMQQSIEVYQARLFAQDQSTSQQEQSPAT